MVDQMLTNKKNEHLYDARFQPIVFNRCGE